MKISEMITELEKNKKEHGDVEVFAWPYDGQGVFYVPKVEVHIEKGSAWGVEISGV
jgi:threonyl-tRNA synthetase